LVSKMKGERPKCNYRKGQWVTRNLCSEVGGPSKEKNPPVQLRDRGERAENTEGKKCTVMLNSDSWIADHEPQRPKRCGSVYSAPPELGKKKNKQKARRSQSKKKGKERAAHMTEKK